MEGKKGLENLEKRINIFKTCSKEFLDSESVDNIQKNVDKKTLLLFAILKVPNERRDVLKRALLLNDFEFYYTKCFEDNSKRSEHDMNCAFDFFPSDDNKDGMIIELKFPRGEIFFRSKEYNSPIYAVHELENTTQTRKTIHSYLDQYKALFTYWLKYLEGA